MIITIVMGYLVEVDGSRRIENWVEVDVQSFRSGPLNAVH